MNRRWTAFVFANWRNKGVALFFATGIWFLAYQSETRRETIEYTVRFVPRSRAASAVISVRAIDDDRADAERAVAERGDETELPAEPPSDGPARVERARRDRVDEVRVSVELSGPRKQIDRRGEAAPSDLVISVESEQEVHTFSAADFGFPDAGVTVSRIAPNSVRIVQRPVVERVIAGLAEKVEVTQYDRGDQKVLREILRPSTGELRIRGPDHIVERVSLRLPVGMSYQLQPVMRIVAPEVLPAGDRLVQQTVELWDQDKEDWVPAARPPRIHVSVRLEALEESLACDAVRVVFQLPLTVVACKVTLREVSPGTDSIPIEFVGPKDQIARLRQACSQGSVTLNVPAPPRFDTESGGTYTFPDESLQLHGYPGVRVVQHKSRREARRAFWSYEVEVFRSKEGD